MTLDPQKSLRCSKCQQEQVFLRMQPAGKFAFPIYADCACVEVDELAERRKAQKAAREAAEGAVRVCAMLNPIPKRLATASLATCTVDADNRIAVRCADQFRAQVVEKRTAEGVPGFALISKEVGTGKTYIAAALVNDLRKNVLCAMLYTVAGAMDAIRDTFGDQERHSALVRAMRTAPVLVLDDLGKEYTKNDSWAATEFYEVVNARWNNALPIIVTSNMTPIELRQTRYVTDREVAIMDRLLGMIDSKAWLQCGGGSRRW